MERPAITIASFVAAISLLLGACGGGGIGGPPNGDYGDAPDGGATGYPGPFTQTGAFPTLFANGGAVTRDTNQATLGPTASPEANANDPNDPDGQPNLNPVNTDADDGLVDFVLVLTSIPPPAALTVNVTAPAGSGGGQFFLNAIIDMNLDGAWGGVASPGVPEWVVKNFPVQLAAGQATPVALPPFLFGFGNRLPDGAWMRILLSREAVTVGDWDGGGTFSAGDVEDHIIRLPRVGPGQKRLIIQMSCPPVVRFPRGRAIVRFGCQVRNIALGPDPGSFSYFLVGFGANAASVIVQPRLPPATLGCLVPPPATPAGGPVSCGNPPADIAIAGAGPVVLPLRGIRVPGAPLPSNWTYSAVGVDPPAVIDAAGVTAGFGDSRGDMAFVETEVEEQGEIQLENGEVVIILRAKDPRIEAPIEVSVRPGETFRGLSYGALRRHGEGPIEIPPAR